MTVAALSLRENRPDPCGVVPAGLIVADNLDIAGDVRSNVRTTA